MMLALIFARSWYVVTVSHNYERQYITSSSSDLITLHCKITFFGQKVGLIIKSGCFMLHLTLLTLALKTDKEYSYLIIYLIN